MTPTHSLPPCPPLPAGHPLLKYSGLSSSGLTDPSILYAQAMKAIDGACETCASLEAVNGESYLEITLVGYVMFVRVCQGSSVPCAGWMAGLAAPCAV